ncbi:hypothetical protein THZG08_170026 [Vibrio owensii]|nr:hypothetical protein THZG08_170026 [Vibrio owensii]CAH1554747.1 hypothetical protein THOA03_170095 [Vibrio owensii]
MKKRERLQNCVSPVVVGGELDAAKVKSFSWLGIGTNICSLTENLT